LKCFVVGIYNVIPPARLVDLFLFRVFDFWVGHESCSWPLFTIYAFISQWKWY